MTASLEALQAFQWTRQPDAESLLRRIVEDFLQRSPFASKLAGRMRDEAGSRFFDWIDSIWLPADKLAEARLVEAGFTRETMNSTHPIYKHPEGIFPRVLMGADSIVHVALKVDSVADFLAINQLDRAIEGQPFAPVRRAMIVREGNVQLDVLERRGSPLFTFGPDDAHKNIDAAEHLELFRRRPRSFENDADGFKHAERLIDAAIADIGRDRACALFFQAEREFWQRRNRAAQVQKSRQDRLGLGWGNHDHHTYRSSRIYFSRLIGFFEKLGLECRERFYAGREAGWGAQVMENLRAGIVVFADVDLAPEELLEDFSHNPLPARNVLGTVGLWCGLHGEAFLQAGMHHLECQFDFAALKEQLEREHKINVMKPFTDFSYLRQAFTEGERWPIAEARLAKLLEAKLITEAQAKQFREQGAIGSHLENLERNEGYKGFNQKGVSEIIAATDPRHHVAAK
jgi:hypothetical protein